jgi:IS5 family transposase
MKRGRIRERERRRKRERERERERERVRNKICISEMELSRNAYFTWDKIIAQVLSVSLVKALYNVLHALELTSGTSRVGFILID